MHTNIHTGQYPKIDFTTIVCESCFEVLLEDDTEYINGRAFCHHCIEEVCQ